MRNDKDRQLVEQVIRLLDDADDYQHALAMGAMYGVAAAKFGLVMCDECVSSSRETVVRMLGLAPNNGNVAN